MYKILSFLLVLFLSHEVFSYPATVKYIVDGDTFVADVFITNDIFISQINVRLMNVDTPELHGQCQKEIEQAEQAKDFLSKIIPVGTKVYLSDIKDDKYSGRMDARVFTEKKQDVGFLIIKNGFGRPYGGEKRRSWCTL